MDIEFPIVRIYVKWKVTKFQKCHLFGSEQIFQIGSGILHKFSPPHDFSPSNQSWDAGREIGRGNFLWNASYLYRQLAIHTKFPPNKKSTNLQEDILWEMPDIYIGNWHFTWNFPLPKKAINHQNISFKKCHITWLWVNWELCIYLFFEKCPCVLIWTVHLFGTQE